MLAYAARPAHKRLSVTFRVESLDSDELLMAHELTPRGMLLTARTPRWPGQMLRLRMTLPGQERAIRLTCRVDALEDLPVGVGFRVTFLRLADEAVPMIARFLARVHADNQASFF